MWSNDKELFQLMRTKLFPAVVGDILDTMGFLHQFFAPSIKPLQMNMVVAGRAMPVLEADVYELKSSSGHNEITQQPFGLMFEALDSLKEDEVYIATGSSLRYALWGGLMSTRARHLKAAGAVLDGYVRDSNEILELNFPTFSHGTYAQDQGPRGKVIDYRVPIEFNGIRVHPGDIVYGDRDGVLIIPQEVERDAISLALEKVSTENRVRTAISNGMSTVEAFETFGVM
ncbi:MULTISPECIES: RraA family protein [Serratia]|jgi:4-hydroxy-4-methyl-2-oxoglutarate aldolase|uniref:RraA family protein n=1 Tax=Serratia TaxID=613 RepID=UPI00061B712B|nr:MULTISPECIES: RraA family protein [Serratia]AKE09596.1 dimethylmenaquinone methyltransferase [Serratia liquefaciens]AYO39042.1 RraA family protein [Serratia sp. P2ACOL2]MCS4317773.1 regulator of RNase E activity RraA [Serratia sp. BIGb0234]MDU5486362.1 RraA family protein [Serratia liquefaciens]NWA21539.1 RraA family protein [Serratia liquefaciens]